MAKKKLLGIEIGNNRIKIAECSEHRLERIVSDEIPDNLVVEDLIVSWEAMAEYIKEVVKTNNISHKDVAVVLPEKSSYIRRVTMPAMTVDQLKVNLPYEFHDYITEDKSKYIFDYAVIEIKKDSEGNPTEMDLLAVACEKEIIEHYKTMFRRAGLRLVSIAPEFAALRNLIKDYEDKTLSVEDREKKDYAILDMGHRLLRLHFFTKGQYEVTRNMEPGCGQLTTYISDHLGVDWHIAQITKESNKDDILNDPGCVSIYNQMAVEIMRVLNFYNFNHPDNNLDTVYYCGGGGQIEPLINEIKEMTDLKIASITDILTSDVADKDAEMIGIQALGITWE